MIKHYKILLTFLIINCAVLIGQTNLVPNGSFEDTVHCPNSGDQLIYAANWMYGAQACEYLNACSPPGNMSVPYSVLGYQYAADGVAYIGADVYVLHDTSIYCYYRDIAAAHLTTPMVIGQKYYCSFKTVCKRDTMEWQEGGCAVNNIGLLFSKHLYQYGYPSSDPIPKRNQAQFYTNQVITDTTHWTTVSGTYVADSAYTIIYVGNFFDSAHTTVIDYYHQLNYSGSYYFIDDIRVSVDSAYGLGIDSKQEKKESFLIYPNPSTGIVNIKPPDNDTYKIELYDILGKKLNMQLPLLLGDEAVEIDISQLSNGTYFITLTNSNTVLSNKVLINK